jgi:hypothetical protein
MEFDPNKMFDRPPQGTDLVEENRKRASLVLHNANLYDEEGQAHGGGAIDEATGKSNLNKDKEPTGVVGGSERKVSKKGDIMGYMQDPNTMSLADFEKEFKVQQGRAVKSKKRILR